MINMFNYNIDFNIETAESNFPKDPLSVTFLFKFYLNRYTSQLITLWVILVKATGCNFIFKR